MSAIMNHYTLSYGANVFGSYSMKDEINVNPDYQRNGDVWTLEKKQLLIDSIINRYDIPKIYFHKSGKLIGQYEYAIIDGRQRLEAIWGFIDGNYCLGNEFNYLRDSKVDISDMTYNDLAKNYPKIKNQFDSTILPIVVVDTDDIDLIEEMFSRLNEAVPLNAAEKRNAIGGYCISAVNRLVKQHFFTRRLKFTNSRYQHREVAIRLLFLEHCMRNNEKLVDTKKVYLDGFAKKFKKDGKEEIEDLLKAVSTITKHLTLIFTDKDSLLAAQASIPIYFLAARQQLNDYSEIRMTRMQLDNFLKVRKENRRVAEKDLESAEFELLEFDRLSQQGTNDASSIRERLRIFQQYLELTH